MVTSTEVKAKMEQEIQVVFDAIYKQIEQKLDNKFNDMNESNSALRELLLSGKIYIGYSLIQRKLQQEFGLSNYSSTWAVILTKVEEILKKNLAEAGWKLDGDYLVPLEEQKEE